MQNAYVSEFEKRGHFAPAIFGRTHVFKWLLLGQRLLKLNEIFIFDHSPCCISSVRVVELNSAEWQQVENMRAFVNCRSKVIPFLKSANIIFIILVLVAHCVAISISWVDYFSILYV